MNIIKFYILYVFIKLISSEDIFEDKFFYNKKFYLELKNSIFYTTIIQNSVSNEFLCSAVDISFEDFMKLNNPSIIELINI